LNKKARHGGRIKTMDKMKDRSSWIGRYNLRTIKKEVIHIMNTRVGLQLFIYVTLMAVAAVGMIMLLTHTAQAGPPDPCANYSKTNDSDGDGIMDYDECKGISINNTTVKFDPTTRDLFYLVGGTPGPWFPTNNPLQYISNPVLDSNRNPYGLGIVVHQITSSQIKKKTDRIVNFPNSNQKAVQVTDSPDMTGDLNLLGFSNTGTPNGLDLSTIYTQHIAYFIQTVCGNLYGTPNCAASTGETGDALVRKYVLHTFNHEVAHTMGPLAPTYSSTYGYHYAPSSTNPSIMDQSVCYKTIIDPGTNFVTKVTFYIGTTFTPADQAGVKLK
jgi:hypothetical protein